MRRVAVIAVCLALAASVSGCAPGESESAPGSTQGRQSAARPIEALTPSAKRATIATSFPAEVPVPMGDFTWGKAQGDSAWDYEVELAAEVGQAAEWYRQAYSGRSWAIVRDAEFDGPTGSGITLEFRKGNAQSSVQVFGARNGSPTRAVVTVGVGTPVLETQ